jgi:hypothetical protein
MFETAGTFAVERLTAAVALRCGHLLLVDDLLLPTIWRLGVQYTNAVRLMFESFERDGHAAVKFGAWASDLA